MGILENAQNAAKKWLLSVALKKGVNRVVMMLVSILTSVTVQPILNQLGIQVNLKQFQIGMAALIMLGLEMLRNWFKMKTGWKWL